MQRGHGLGSVLSGLFRNVWLLIRNGLKKFRITYIQNWCGRGE